MHAGQASSLSLRFPGRAEAWSLRSRVLTLGSRPLLMGVLNVTPDSFSDGGNFLDTGAAFARGQELERQGADILDIGGQSTRPNATEVAADEELRRVMPVLEKLAGQLRIPISIDTFHATVAREAVAAGAEIINDVTALAQPDMRDVASETGAGVCAMHMQGSPQTMQDKPTYEDVGGEVYQYLRARRDALEAAGISRDKIALDPGIGFGKTHQHNLTLLAACHRLHELGCPVLVGHSRKGFIGKVLGNKEADRTAGGIGIALALASQGVQILRTHDVGPVREALLLYEACGGIDGAIIELV